MSAKATQSNNPHRIMHIGFPLPAWAAEALTVEADKQARSRAKLLKFLALKFLADHGYRAPEGVNER